MTDRRRRTLLAFLVLVSLLLVTLDYRQGGDGPLAALQRGALAVFAPVQEGFATITRPIGGLISTFAELGSVRERNAALEAEVQELRQGKVSQAELQRENAELRALLDMRKRQGFTTTAARVIAQPTSSFEWTVLIDAGAAQGIRKGMAVLNADGLVGRIVEVTRHHARVQLLTSPEAGYAVRVVDTLEEGLLRGQGAELFQLEVFSPEADLPRGAEVVTQAFEGTAIPDGIPIGVVEDDGGQQGTRFRSVRPYVNFNRLSLVQVVLDAPVHPEELDADELVEEEAGGRPSPPRTDEGSASPPPALDRPSPTGSPGEAPSA